MNKENIDAIIPFVIGEDRKWQSEFTDYLANCNRVYVPGPIGYYRFRSLNQIFNCVWSIITYMPWIRKIHLVSCGQKIPNHRELEILTERNNGPELVYVDHKQIFTDKSHLPCFNSDAIHPNYVNIKDLADKCVYFDDDVIVANPIKATDFFPGNHNCVVNLNSPKKLEKYQGESLEVWQLVRNNTIDYLIQKNFKPPFITLTHFPYPFTKKALFEVVELFSERLAYTSSCKIRCPDSVLMLDLLVNYMLAKNIAKISHKVKVIEIGLHRFRTKKDADKLFTWDYDVLNIIDCGSIANEGPVLQNLDEFYKKFRSDELYKKRLRNKKLKKRVWESVANRAKSVIKKILNLLFARF